MRAEELCALASAHGVDLVAAARLGTAPAKRDTVRRGHNGGHSYQVLLEPPAQRANGHASRSHTPGAWTISELGQAAAGVRRIPFLAACYAYAGDHSCYWVLWAELERAAQELRARHHWPAQVKSAEGSPRFYLEQISQLVLDEDAHQHLFTAAPVLYSIYVGVDEGTWRRAVFERFDAVKMRFLGWISEAMHTMQPRLEELADDAD